MQRYEYKVVPAPARAEKVRGVRSAEDRFAHALAQAMNAMAAEGWEYQRAETLPCEESKGFLSTGRVTVYRNMLVFRRALAAAEPAAAPDRPTADTQPAPAAATPAAAPALGPAAEGHIARRTPAQTRAGEAPAPVPVPAGPRVAAVPPPAGPQPVLRAARSEPPSPVRRLNLQAEEAPENPIFRWPLRAQAGEGAPRPVQRGE